MQNVMIAGLTSARDSFLNILNIVLPYALAVLIAGIVLSAGIKWFLHFLGFAEVHEATEWEKRYQHEKEESAYHNYATARRIQESEDDDD